MLLTVEIPDNAKRVRILVDETHCDNSRYKPGYWNGLHGGRYYGQYFDMEDENRMREMVEVASVLDRYGIWYEMTKFKRKYRITIHRNDYWNMSNELRNRIAEINNFHDRQGET